MAASPRFQQPVPPRPLPLRAVLPRTVRMRTVLLLLGALGFMLPVVGLLWLRVYDTQLVRQTESELLAQAALIGATIQHQMSGALAGESGAEIEATVGAEVLLPRPATLDIATHSILPPAPDAEPALHPVAPRYQALGARLGQILRLAKTHTLAAVRVVDTNGTVFASSSGELGASLLQQAEIQKALAGQSVSSLRQRVARDRQAPPLSSISRSTGVRVFVATPVFVEGRVQAAVLLSRTPMTLGKALYQDGVQLLSMSVVLFSALLLVALLAAYLVVRPIHLLAAMASALGRGEGEASAPHGLAKLRHPITTEVAEVSDAIALAFSTLQARGAYIQNFAAHVSHEFKTPLTAINGALLLLQEHEADMTKEERQRFVRNALADTAMLERLVQRLLELARADVAKPSSLSRCSARQVIESVVMNQGQKRQEGIKAELSALPAGVFVMIDEVTFGSVLTSLLDNAFIHGRPPVSVTARANQHLEVEVMDAGPGVSEANESRIFHPFFTTARATGSTGLGLTIARALVRAHRGELSYDRQKAAFVLHLPLVASPAAAATV